MYLCGVAQCDTLVAVQVTIFAMKQAALLSSDLYISPTIDFANFYSCLFILARLAVPTSIILSLPTYLFFLFLLDMSLARLNFLCTPSQLVWLLCAAVSVSSSKHILCNLSLHYPAHLFMLQLCITLVLSITDTLLHATSSYQKWLLLKASEQYYRGLLPSCLLSLSYFLILQALLHTRNAVYIALGSVST